MTEEADEKSGSTVTRPTGPTFEYAANLQAPDVFADGASGFQIFQGNVRVTLESIRCAHVTQDDKYVRVVIGRLVMPVAAAQGLAVGLFDFLKRHGIAPPGFDPGTKPQ